ncbi:MAG: hypothetical protein CMO97_00235 [Woeseia sp.]|nr:hypothetical protein [Woeseia sp.]|tara:strand:- start:396 stop:629 length:234 start_codon:yes stop_codon:yes gene_type:complete
MKLNGGAIGSKLEPISPLFLRGKNIPLKNSQIIEDLKHECIYSGLHKDGRRSFKSLDKLIKMFELSPSTIYRHSFFN